MLFRSPHATMWRPKQHCGDLGGTQRARELSNGQAAGSLRSNPVAKRCFCWCWLGIGLGLGLGLRFQLRLRLRLGLGLRLRLWRPVRLAVLRHRSAVHSQQRFSLSPPPITFGQHNTQPSSRTPWGAGAGRGPQLPPAPPDRRQPPRPPSMETQQTLPPAPAPPPPGGPAPASAEPRVPGRALAGELQRART
jgi:hypothetical protein